LRIEVELPSNVVLVLGNLEKSPCERRLLHIQLDRRDLEVGLRTRWRRRLRGMRLLPLLPPSQLSQRMLAYTIVETFSPFQRNVSPMRSSKVVNRRNPSY
jgi:hypothetical protein